MTLRSAAPISAVLLFSCLAPALVAQTTLVPGVPIGGGHLRVEPGSGDADHTVFVLTGSVWFADAGLQVRAESAVVTLDRDDTSKSRDENGRLPRRDLPLPASQRRLSPVEMQRRLQRLLHSLGRPAPAETADTRAAISVFRSLYLEGDVVFVRDGFELLRARSAFFSVADERAVFEDVVLRLAPTRPGSGPGVVVLRGKQLIRQGPRIHGRDIAVTTDISADPQFEVVAGEIEVVDQADDGIWIRSRGNRLHLGDVDVMPLPDTNFRAGEPIDVPIKGLSLGYSNLERFAARLDLGSSMHRLGGALHHFFTGRPENEFRGDWRLGLGYRETRGFPLDATLRYATDRFYRGQTDLFTLRDDGKDIRDIRTRLDGSPIANSERALVRTQNRLELDPDAYIDLELFWASDPAVLSEFYRGWYVGDEAPETRVRLRDAAANQLFAVSGRFNLAKFAYADDRRLSPSFREELPVASFDLFSQPVLDLPGGSTLELSTTTMIGQQRSNYDDTVTTRMDDRVFRMHQGAELAATWDLGPWRLRPFLGADLTAYGRTIAGNDEKRIGMGGGATLATRLVRDWTGSNTSAIRHTIHPTIAFQYRFAVDDDPGEFFQHDAIDADTERAGFRVGTLHRFDHHSTANGQRQSAEFLWLDVGQTVFPISKRDNAGDLFGLFDFELILRPLPAWSPLPNLRLLVEGEMDWARDELRTFNTAMRFGKVIGMNWHASYRTDASVDGVVGYGADADLFGRWHLAGFGQYDLQTNRSLNYLVSLQRRDRNWTLSFNVDYDVVTDDLGFRLDFEPTLGGLFRSRADRLRGRYTVDPLE